jgi:hypothetical protein
MNDLMLAGLAGMIASWIAIQILPGGVMEIDAVLALLCLLSLAAALVGGGMVVAGVMR